MFDKRPKIGDDLIEIRLEGSRQYYKITDIEDGYVRGCRSELNNTTTIRKDLPYWDKDLDAWTYHVSY